MTHKHSGLSLKKLSHQQHQLVLLARFQKRSQQQTKNPGRVASGKTLGL